MFYLTKVKKRYKKNEKEKKSEITAKRPELCKKVFLTKNVKNLFLYLYLCLCVRTKENKHKNQSKQ